MSEQTPADELRAAADLLGRAASEATPGPWKYAAGSSRGEQYHVETPDGAIGIDIDYGSELDEGDARWIALMSPIVAAPLAAWLRRESVNLAMSWTAWCPGQKPPSPVDEPPAVWTEETRMASVQHHYGHALDFARAIIDATPQREETP